MQKSLSYLKRLSFEASPLKWIVLAAVSDYLLLVCWHSRRDAAARYPANADPGTKGAQLTIEQNRFPTLLYICTLACFGQDLQQTNRKLKK